MLGRRVGTVTDWDGALQGPVEQIGAQRDPASELCLNEFIPFVTDWCADRHIRWGRGSLDRSTGFPSSLDERAPMGSITPPALPDTT